MFFKRIGTSDEEYELNDNFNSVVVGRNHNCDIKINGNLLEYHFKITKVPPKGFLIIQHLQDEGMTIVGNTVLDKKDAIASAEIGSIITLGAPYSGQKGSEEPVILKLMFGKAEKFAGLELDFASKFYSDCENTASFTTKFYSDCENTASSTTKFYSDCENTATSTTKFYSDCENTASSTTKLYSDCKNTASSASHDCSAVAYPKRELNSDRFLVGDGNNGLRDHASSSSSNLNDIIVSPFKKFKSDKSGDKNPKQIYKYEDKFKSDDKNPKQIYKYEDKFKKIIADNGDKTYLNDKDDENYDFDTILNSMDPDLDFSEKLEVDSDDEKYFKDLKPKKLTPKKHSENFKVKNSKNKKTSSVQDLRKNKRFIDQNETSAENVAINNSFSNQNESFTKNVGINNSYLNRIETLMQNMGKSKSYLNQNETSTQNTSKNKSFSNQNKISTQNTSKNKSFSNQNKISTQNTSKNKSFSNQNETPTQNTSKNKSFSNQNKIPTQNTSKNKSFSNQNKIPTQNTSKNNSFSNFNKTSTQNITIRNKSFSKQNKIPTQNTSENNIFSNFNKTSTQNITIRNKSFSNQNKIPTQNTSENNSFSNQNKTSTQNITIRNKSSSNQNKVSARNKNVNSFYPDIFNDTVTDDDIRNCSEPDQHQNLNEKNIKRVYEISRSSNGKIVLAQKNLFFEYVSETPSSTTKATTPSTTKATQSSTATNATVSSTTKAIIPSTAKATQSTAKASASSITKATNQYPTKAATQSTTITIPLQSAESQPTATTQLTTADNIFWQEIGNKHYFLRCILDCEYECFTKAKRFLGSGKYDAAYLELPLPPTAQFSTSGIFSTMENYVKKLFNQIFYDVTMSIFKSWFELRNLIWISFEMVWNNHVSYENINFYRMRVSVILDEMYEIDICTGSILALQTKKDGKTLFSFGYVEKAEWKQTDVDNLYAPESFILTLHILTTRDTVDLSKGGTMISLINLLDIKTYFTAYKSVCDLFRLGFSPLMQNIIHSKIPLKGPYVSRKFKDNNLKLKLTQNQKDIISNLATGANLNLVNGPPASGKSTMICGLIFHIKSFIKKSKFLVCTSTDAGLDLLIQKLLAIGNDQLNIVRIGEKNQISKSVQRFSLENLIDNEVKGKFSNRKSDLGLDVFKELSAKDFLNDANVVALTFDYFSKVDEYVIRALKHSKLTTCLVDDAHLCFEYTNLIPLTLGIQKLVLFGDSCQNGTKKLGFFRDYLQHFMNVFYEQNSISRSLYHRIYENSAIEHDCSAEELIFIYRLPPLTWRFLDVYFYDHVASIYPSLAQNSFELKQYAVFNLMCGGGDKKLNEEMSNVYEAKLIKNLLQVHRNYLKDKTIAVVTPYEEQKVVLQVELACFFDTNLDLTICTLEHAQGLEKDVVYCSMVRLRSSLMQTENHTQFLITSLTRARLSCFFIGNLRSLKLHEPYNELARDAKKRNLVYDISKLALEDEEKLLSITLK